MEKIIIKKFFNYYDKQFIIETLSKINLTDTELKIIQYVDINNQTQNYTACMVGYSPRSIYTHRKKALNKIYYYIKNNKDIYCKVNDIML